MGVPYAEVIGDPIAHSKSPLIHKFWLEKLDLEGDFRAVRIAGDELPSYLEGRRKDPDWRGCSVTQPHKVPILNHLDTVARHASNLGAVNAVRRDEGGRLHGRNTDVHGVWRSLDEVMRPGMRIVLVGAGGAARAAAYAIRAHSPSKIIVMNRTLERAEKLVQDLRLNGEVRVSQSIPPADLVINASSGPTSTDLSKLDDDAVVFDMIYDPVETPLLRSAKARKLRVVDGLTMLVNQATEAFAIFYRRGHPADRDDELRELLTR